VEKIMIVMDKNTAPNLYLEFRNRIFTETLLNT